MDHQVSLDELSAALANGELSFYYQPKVSMVTGKVCGAEALIRWIKPDGRVIMPNTFIPLAEESRFITTISQRMFPKLLEDMVIINGLNAELRTSFNLSAKDFENRTMLGLIDEAISSDNISAGCLQAEITEASVINEHNLAIRRNLNELNELGVTLAMDDYGTGYSSIDSLSKWPFDVVKLDHGLISRMRDSERSTTIVQASIRMAHQLKMGIVAEGIESAEAFDFLLHSGCTEAQGFWIARPIPLAEYLSFINRDQRWLGLPTGLIHMAILDHINWRKDLISQVTHIAFNNSGPVEICAPAAELDPHLCKLGQWYDGPGQEFSDHELFLALERPHKELHRIGSMLLDAAMANASRDDLVNMMRQLTHQSSILLELLQELESEALLESPINMASLSAG